MEISPEHFLNELLGYQKTSALKAAIELDLFSALAAAGGDLAQVSERTGASERGIRILCDYLTVKGFLEKKRPAPAHSVEPDIPHSSVASLHRQHHRVSGVAGDDPTMAD
jgi:hypothetical protein